MGQCVRVSFRLAPCEMHASAAWCGAGGGRRRPSSLPRLLGGERNWAAGMIGLVGTRGTEATCSAQGCRIAGPGNMG